MLSLPDIAPSHSSRLTERVRLREATFGDGYVQVAADGINNTQREYRVEWRGAKRTDADALISFFRQLEGLGGFAYTLSDESAARTWRCKVWSRQRISASHDTVTANFIETVEP